MDEVTPDSIFVHSEDIVSREMQGELIIVPLTSGIGDVEDELYTLNGSGRAIWTLMDGRRTLREIALELSGQYNGSPEVIARDVMGIACELARRKIIVNRK